MPAPAPEADPAPAPTRHLAPPIGPAASVPVTPAGMMPPARGTQKATTTTTPAANAAKPSLAPNAAPVRNAAPPERARVAPSPAPRPAVATTGTPLPAKPAAWSAPVPPAAAAVLKPASSAMPKATEPPSAPPIDSTQTLRALVVPGDADVEAEKLLVIQLVLSEREIEPESVPNLAIFNEFRLYSAVGYEHGKVMHALRLGFFTDEGPAEAVAGYLRSYFEAPVVTRVSVEERERFAKRRVAARKDSGDTGLHAAIELSSAPTQPTTSLADLTARTRTGQPAKPGHERKRG